MSLQRELDLLSAQIDALTRVIETNTEAMRFAKRRIAELEAENRRLTERISRESSFVAYVTSETRWPTLDNGRECATGAFLKDAANMETE